MIPRAPQCDDDRCDYDETGTWRHHPRCQTQDPWAEDMAAQTALEDGYARRPKLTAVPAFEASVTV
jgi:hypothetical protein